MATSDTDVELVHLRASVGGVVPPPASGTLCGRFDGRATRFVAEVTCGHCVGEFMGEDPGAELDERAEDPGPGAPSTAEEFEQVYRRYARPVTALFVHWGLGWATAEDLTSDVFTRLWQDMSTRLVLTDIEHLWGFLRRRSCWALGTHFQRRRALSFLEDSAVPLEQQTRLVDTAPGPEACTVTRLEVQRTLAVLPESKRRLVSLRYLEGLTSVQVAEATGLAEYTVRRYLGSALDTVREAEGLPVDVARKAWHEARASAARDVPAAIEAYRASVAAGAPMAVTALAARFGHSARWAQGVVRAHGEHRPRPMAETTARMQLRAQLAAGRWAPGEDLPAAKDLAPELGVPAIKVCRILHTLAGEGLIERRYAPGNRAAYTALSAAAAPAPAPAPVSLFDRVTTDLTTALTDGTYPPGTLLPTGGALGRRYGASGTSMVNVLGALVERGLLERAGHRFIAPGGATPLATGDAQARVAGALREAIEAGLYPPGAALPSRSQLAKHFAVSTTTAMYALRALTAAGLAEQHNGRRYHTTTHAALTAPRPALVTDTYLVTGRTPTGANTFPTARLEAAA
jgi:RNA polymerase sigma factor (sigma-70 family)